MNIGLIFGMIVAIIVMVAIIVFGYNQLTSVQDLQQEAEYKRVMKSFGDAVDRVYNLGGESSEKFTLSLPSMVDKVCFVPFFEVNDNSGERELYSGYDLESDVDDVLKDSNLAWKERDQLLDILVGQAEDENGDLDPKPVLVFYTTGGAPEWQDIPHLGPTKDENGDIICARPGSQLWLKRRFDSQGAWVDIEEI